MLLLMVYGCERLCSLFVFYVGQMSVDSTATVVQRVLYRSFTHLSTSSAQSQFHVGIQLLYRLLIYVLLVGERDWSLRMNESQHLQRNKRSHCVNQGNRKREKLLTLVHRVSPKLQALVYDILPSTTAVFCYWRRVQKTVS